MHRKHKSIARYIGLTAGLVLSFCMRYKVKANPLQNPTNSYTLNAIKITSTGAIEPMVSKPYPYLRFLQWLTPTTNPSLIYRTINLEPGSVFDDKALLSIKKRLMALSYFETVSIRRKAADKTTTGKASLFDLVITTKDRFPITVDLSLDQGPLVTITHHNAWGYGHGFSHQLFLKKRWGYGFEYEFPKLHGSYIFGGQHYKQIGNTYKFNHQNLWLVKLFTIKDPLDNYPYYWITGVSGYRKHFMTSPPVGVMQNRPYHNYRCVLGKIGWVADGYEAIRGVYTLHTLEKLPKGGSIEILYGYQNGAFTNRHYVGINCIKNIVSPTFKHLYLRCEAGTYINKQALEETIVKLALTYAGPSIEGCNGARQFIVIDYITGCRMPKERMLGIIRRDPEALEAPDKDNSMQKPIHTRLNVHLDSTLHRPIPMQPIRFVVVGFTNFIALQNNQLLNQTWVDSYGIGIQLEHLTMSWPNLICKIGYSPLLGKAVHSIQLTLGHFKNKTDPKPTTVTYS